MRLSIFATASCCAAFIGLSTASAILQRGGRLPRVDVSNVRRNVVPRRPLDTPPSSPPKDLIAPQGPPLSFYGGASYAFPAGPTILFPSPIISSSSISHSSSGASPTSVTTSTTSKAEPAPTTPPSSSPSLPPLLTPRNVDCNRPETGLDPECWKLLNLTEYVNQWMAENGAKLCAPAKVPFSTCFQRSLRVMDDCTGIKEQACVPPKNIYSPEDFYVLYNIYSINQFFFSWWSALNGANSLASEAIDSIVNTIQPPEKQNVGFTELLVAISTSLAFLAVPAGVGLGVGAALGVELVFTAIQQTVAVSRFLFPARTVDKSNIQIGQISADLSKIVMDFQARVSGSINAIETNHTAFLTFASTGAFIGEIPSVQDQQVSLYQGLLTFVISEAFNANGIIATVGLDTDVSALQRNQADSLSYDIDCPSYDANGVCNAWWYDANANASYALDNLHQMSKNYHDAMGTFFSNKWTTGALLFGGAADCKANGDVSLGPALATSPGAPTQVSCLSTLKLCTWKYDCGLDARCEFTDCDTQYGFGFDGCRGDPQASLYSVAVPAGYLGDFLWEANPMSTVCNY